MPRYGTKTYSRKGKDSVTSNDFDDIFTESGKKGNMPTKTASTHQRWGNMTYTSSRLTRKTASEMQAREEQPQPMVSPKRRRLTDDSGDPFSFESDDERVSPRRKNRQPPPESPQRRSQMMSDKSKVLTNLKQGLRSSAENTKINLTTSIHKVEKEIVTSKAKASSSKPKPPAKVAELRSKNIDSKSKVVLADAKSKSMDLNVRPTDPRSKVLDTKLKVVDKKVDVSAKIMETKAKVLDKKFKPADSGLNVVETLSKFIGEKSTSDVTSKTLGNKLLHSSKEAVSLSIETKVGETNSKRLDSKSKTKSELINKFSSKHKFVASNKCVSNSNSYDLITIPMESIISVKPKRQVTLDRFTHKPAKELDGIRTQEEHAYAQKSPPKEKTQGIMHLMEEEHAYAQKPLPNKMEEEHAYAQRPQKQCIILNPTDYRTNSHAKANSKQVNSNSMAKTNSQKSSSGLKTLSNPGSKTSTHSVTTVKTTMTKSLPRTSSAPSMSSLTSASHNSGKDAYDFDDADDDFVGTVKRVKVMKTYSRHGSSSSLKLSGNAGGSQILASSQTSTGSTALSPSPSSSQSSTQSSTQDTYKFDDSDDSDTCIPSSSADEQIIRKVRPMRTNRFNTFTSSISGSKIKKNLTEQKPSPKKTPTKAVYNARPWQANTKTVTENDSEDEEDTLSELNNPVPSTSSPGLVRSVSYPTKLYDDAVTSIKCNKQAKPLYTVVKHVKQAHQCQEIGESQQFIDDIEYLLDGLNDTETMATRCLSAVELAGKCAVSSFRMHLRAHGMAAKIFTAVHDAATNPSLAMCTSALMHMLSKDRLNMDLDQKSLGLLVKLLSVDPRTSPSKLSKEYNRTKEKVRSIYKKLPSAMVKGLDLNNLTTSCLALESLLSLIAMKSGEWFKEELRKVDGLDYFVHTVSECVESLTTLNDSLTDSMIEKVSKMERCLQVLESVTFMNAENQGYLITFENFLLVSSTIKALRLCERFVQIYAVDEESDSSEDISTSKKPGIVIRKCLLSVLKLLLNLTHDNEWGSTKIGERDGLIPMAFCCLLQTPQYLPIDQRFDILVLSLGLLINLVEHSAKNRKALVATNTQFSYDSQSENESCNSVDDDAVSSVEALVQLFLQRERAAKEAEKQKDAFNDPEQLNDKSGKWIESEEGLEWVVIPEKGDSSPQNTKEKVKKSITKALHKAGKQMEDSIVASYIALLIGCLIQDNSQTLTKVKQFLPQGDFSGMVEMLTKFLDFMSLTVAAETKGTKSISRVIEVLETS